MDNNQMIHKIVVAVGTGGGGGLRWIAEKHTQWECGRGRVHEGSFYAFQPIKPGQQHILGKKVAPEQDSPIARVKSFDIPSLRHHHHLILRDLKIEACKGEGGAYLHINFVTAHFGHLLILKLKSEGNNFSGTSLTFGQSPINSFWREVRCWSPTETDSTFSNPVIPRKVRDEGRRCDS
ncbi:hypothetical protein LXL04_023223 [Taraxacum kok-saghyz]